MVWVNFTTGQARLLDIHNLRTDNMPPLMDIFAVHWSPDGKKLAIDTGKLGYGESQLFIFDLETNQLDFIPHHFTSILEVIWTPDSLQLLLLSNINEESFFAVGALFIVDSRTSDIKPVPVLPMQAVVNFDKHLVWNSDGKYVVMQISDEDGNSLGTHTIEVE
jgi:Tol biopolymer transport system component